MTAQVVPFAVLTAPAWTRPDEVLLQSARFVSTCPSCRDHRWQLRYSARALIRMLHREQPIEASCGVCDSSWPISEAERTRIADDLVRGTPA
ncbi:MAG: hypothetical protein JO184_11735 [Gammaproteobacteria bacterium]|nr:hypothetical protein [Gammaproteobacteria bacterium]MBV8307549.1 hypothetical protein [Gammaproteobacteria bacterium]